MNTKGSHHHPAAATAAVAEEPADRRGFVLDGRAWDAFDIALSRPSRDVPGLVELLARPTVLDGARGA